MKTGNCYFIFLLLTVLLLAACAGAPLKTEPGTEIEPAAPAYANPVLEEVSAFLQNGSVDSPDKAESVSMLFHDVDRSEIDRDELYEFKYQLEQWRHAFVHDSLKRIAEAADASDILRELELLEAIALRMTESDLVIIGERINAVANNQPETLGAFRKLILKQGDFELTGNLYRRFKALAPFYDEDSIVDGPDKTLKILPLLNSGWPWKRWSKYSEFKDYSRVNGNVVYRGIEFESGDVLVSTLNSYSDSAFVVYTEKKDLASHMSVYIDVITPEGRFPSVFEMKGNGFRLVPLNVYLRPRFIAYTEILRFKDLPADASEKLSAAAFQLLEEDHGFNLFADEEHSNNYQYVTCITGCRYLFLKAGIDKKYPPESEISKKFLDFNPHMGFATENMQVPSDLLAWDEVTLNAVIDNGDFTDNITRQLIIDKFYEYLLTWPISEKDGEYKFYRGASKTTLNNTFLIAPIMRGLFKYNKNNFPMGTPPMLAFMELMPFDLKDAVHKLTPAIRELMDEYRLWDSFSYSAFCRNPAVQALTEASLEKAERWFEMDEE